jgi:MFS family permease
MKRSTQEENKEYEEKDNAKDKEAKSGNYFYERRYPKIKYKYVLAWLLTISIGMFQFGYSMAVMNQFLLSFCKFFYGTKTWTPRFQSIFTSLITVAVPVGAFLGSNISGYFLKISRRKFLIAVNLLLLACLPFLVVGKNQYIFISGRLLYGICTGLFSSGWVILVREIVPDDVSGFMSAINLCMPPFGIMVVSVLGFIVPKYDSSGYEFARLGLMAIVPGFLSILKFSYFRSFLLTNHLSSIKKAMIKQEN